jgi:hypothetical protein
MPESESILPKNNYVTTCYQLFRKLSSFVVFKELKVLGDSPHPAVKTDKQTKSMLKQEIHSH